MIKKRKGIILAGGTGTRLYPITKSICKQLIPVYDKPMIYYPISTLLLCGITEILIICTPKDLDTFKNLLGDGNELGINFKYLSQSEPRGIADAFLVGEEFIANDKVALVLGDNIFYGNNLADLLKNTSSLSKTSTIFAYQVADPSRYGIIEFDKEFKVKDIKEKPQNPKSNFAITGLYFYDNSVIDKAKQLSPSKRGELEITDINKLYLQENKLEAKILRRGMVWLDTGTHDSLNEASNYIRTIEQRQGLKISCPEEISWRMGLINDDDLEKLASKLLKTGYGKYLMNLLYEDK